MNLNFKKNYLIIFEPTIKLNDLKFKKIIKLYLMKFN